MEMNEEEKRSEADNGGEGGYRKAWKSGAASSSGRSIKWL
jgi:hypothetical protein